MFTSSNAYITKYYDTVHQPSVLFINSFLASCIPPTESQNPMAQERHSWVSCHCAWEWPSSLDFLLCAPIITTSVYMTATAISQFNTKDETKMYKQVILKSISVVFFFYFFFGFSTIIYNPLLGVWPFKQCLDIWALSRSEPTFIWNNQLELICHEIHSKNE